MTGETVEQWRARMRAKGEELRRFRDLDRAAQTARVVREPAPKPKPVTKPRQRAVVGAGIPTACVQCSHPMVPNSAPAKPGNRRHNGRGLCTACYQRARYQARTSA